MGYLFASFFSYQTCFPRLSGFRALSGYALVDHGSLPRYFITLGLSSTKVYDKIVLRFGPSKLLKLNHKRFI